MTNRPVSHQGLQTASRPEFSAHRGIRFSIERCIGVLSRSARSFKLTDRFNTPTAISGVFLTLAGAYLLLVVAFLEFDHGSNLPIGLGAIAMLVGAALIYRRSHQFRTSLSVAIAGAPAVVIAAAVAVTGAPTSYLGASLAPAIMLSAVLAAKTRTGSGIVPASVVISFPLAVITAANVTGAAGADLGRLTAEIPIYATVGVAAAIWARSRRASTETRDILAGVARRVAFDLEAEGVYSGISFEIEKLVPYDRLAIVVGADEASSSIAYSRLTVESTNDEPFQPLSGISIPFGPPSEPQGRIVLYSLVEDMYTDRDIRLVERLVKQIWPAILNAWLYGEAIQMAEERVRALDAVRENTELRNARAELVRVNDELKWQYEAVRDSRRRLMEAHEVAKKAVAEELHGTVQTKLYAAWMRLGRVRDNLTDDHPDSAELTRLVDDLDAIREQDIRLLSHRLHPNIIRLGLAAGLRSMRDHYYDSVQVDLVLSDDAVALEIGGASEIDESIRLGLYRIAELALGNVLKHAKTDSCTIELDYNRATALLSLTVADDGIGFPPNARVSEGLGVVTMNDYADALGGRLKITSLPGEGAAVSVSVPLKSSAGADQTGAAIGTVVNMHWASPVDAAD